MAAVPHASWAEVYDAVYETEFGALYASLTQLTLDVITSRAQPGARIVDFGAGTGRLSIPLARRGFRVVAVDPCEPMLHRITQSAPEQDIPIVVSTMQSFATDEPFDLALCVFTVVIYLLDETELRRAFEACAGALRPGGLVLLDVPMDVLFADRTSHVPGLVREVRMKPVGGDLYEYEERIVIGKAPDQHIYQDAFHVRAWSVKEVLSACEDAGLHLAEDLSATFAGTGARYFVLRKPGDEGRGP